MKSMRCPTLTDLPPPPPGKIGWPWTEESPQLPDTMPDGSAWPRVSIVMPSYNQGQFIEETIRSVLLQGYPDLEYAIMDGGSSDGSVDIIRKYEPWLASWCSEQDNGQADAINKGWQRATGDLLGWINSDDILTPGSIATAVRYLKEHPHVGFVFGDLERIDAQGRRFGLTTYKEFDLLEIVKNAGWISQPGNLFRRTVFERVGPLDISLHFMMDFDYWLRAGLVCQFGYLRLPLARFRRHEEAKSTTKTYLAAHDVLAVYRKFFGRPDLPADLMAIRQRAWAGAHLYAAIAWYCGNHLSSARAELWAALRCDAGMILRRPFWRILPRTLFATLVGSRDSRVYQFARVVCRRGSSRHKLSTRTQP